MPMNAHVIIIKLYVSFVVNYMLIICLNNIFLLTCNVHECPCNLS